MISSFAMDIKLTSNIFSTVCRVFLTFIGLKNIKHDNTISRIIWSMWLGYDQSHEDQQYHYEGTTSIDGNRRWSSDLEDNKFVCPLLLPLRLLNPPIQSFFNLLFSPARHYCSLTIKKQARQQWQRFGSKTNFAPSHPAIIIQPAPLRWLNVSKQLAFKMGLTTSRVSIYVPVFHALLIYKIEKSKKRSGDRNK